jgi:hypothetical protein
MCRSRMATIAAAAALLISGCGAPAAPQASPSGTATPQAPAQLPPPRATCGTSHTAVNVPVLVEVEKGAVACSVAMRIQSGYTALVRAGKVRGNGGGAPVNVNGWTCQGEDTTTVVQTGVASECHRSGTEIIAVLKLQSPSAPAGPGTGTP